MPKRHIRKEDNKELIEMAAEQFANLFWRQWQYMKESEKSKSRKYRPKKSENLLSSSLL